MLRSSSLYLLCFFCSIYGVFAQILKVDKSHLTTDSSGYITGVVDAAFALNNRSSTANKENVYIGFRNHLDLVHIGEQGATILIGGINYFKIGDGPLISNGTGHLRHILRRNVDVSPELFVQIQYDESRNMVSRELLGGGLRFNPVRGENSVHMGIGAFYEYELWNNAELRIAKYLWKMNSYVGCDVRLNQSMKFNSIIYFQTGKDAAINAFRSRLSGHIELKDRVSNHFTLKLMADFHVDDRPIIPLNTFIYETYFGVQYSFN
jgi:hypothetical protein